jgi:hypothetical protein
MIIRCNFEGCGAEATFGFYAQLTDHPELREPLDRVVSVPPAWFRCRTHASYGPPEPPPNGATTVLTSPQAAASLVFRASPWAEGS